MVENLLIALAGGGVALALTVWTAGTLSAFLPAHHAAAHAQRPSGCHRIAGHAAGFHFTAVIAGMVPALRASAFRQCRF